MGKEVLQITITKRRLSKYKLLRWFQHKWFIVWSIWRPKVTSKFCWYVSQGILKILPEHEREKLLKEFEEIEVHIIDERKDERN